MNSRVWARQALTWTAACCAAVLTQQASAAELPKVKLAPDNAVPACATPGRLMAFLEGRNTKLDQKFSTIAADYMRIGEELGIRWDAAFFQMMLETGNLTYKGDVSASQNNFAGLGATGRKAPGETFPDVPTGVKAHLQHLLMYAGETIENPVAERTRNVQDWGVLTSWQKSIKEPMTFTLLASKWAPGSRAYSRDIKGISDAFYAGPCNGEDPKPELLALAKPKNHDSTKSAAAVSTASNEKSESKISGADLARRAVEEARASGSFVRSALGASSLVPAETAAKPSVGEPAASPPVTIINAEQPAAEAASTEETPKVAALGSTGAATAAAAKPAQTKKSAGCKVWTASYGGTRAIIIKAPAEAQQHFTVLDVNEGSEKREAEAYIAAYAKGGEMIGEFASPEQALNKAFELCPES